MRNLAFDTLPLEEVVKAFKDNQDDTEFAHQPLDVSSLMPLSCAEVCTA